MHYGKKKFELDTDIIVIASTSTTELYCRKCGEGVALSVCVCVCVCNNNNNNNKRFI